MLYNIIKRRALGEDASSLGGGRSLTWGEAVSSGGGRSLTWGRRVPEAADKIAFYRVKVFLFELF